MVRADLFRSPAILGCPQHLWPTLELRLPWIPGLRLISSRNEMAQQIYPSKRAMPKYHNDPLRSGHVHESANPVLPSPVWAGADHRPQTVAQNTAHRSPSATPPSREGNDFYRWHSYVRSSPRAKSRACEGWPAML